MLLPSLSLSLTSLSNEPSWYSIEILCLHADINVFTHVKFFPQPKVKKDTGFCLGCYTLICNSFPRIQHYKNSDFFSFFFFGKDDGEDERVRFSRCCAFVLARKIDDNVEFGRGKVGRRIDSECDDALCGVLAGGQVVV